MLSYINVVGKLFKKKYIFKGGKFKQKLQNCHLLILNGQNSHVTIDVVHKARWMG
jgi:hypothetical protein